MKSSWIHFSSPHNLLKTEQNWNLMLHEPALFLLGNFWFTNNDQEGRWAAAEVWRGLLGAGEPAAWPVCAHWDAGNGGLWLASADNTDISLVNRAAGGSICSWWIPRGWSGKKLCTSRNVFYKIFAGLMKFILNIFFLLIIVCRTRDRTFESVTHLIDYHRNNKLPIISAESALRLDTPVIRVRRWGVLSTQHVI